MSIKDDHHRLVGEKIGEFEILPHVIPLEMLVSRHQLGVGSGVSHHQMNIPKQEHDFLVRRILFNYCVTAFRLISLAGGKVYYEAPGWVHYDNFDYFIDPPIVLRNDQSWMMDVSVDNNYPAEHIRVALLGQKAVNL